MSLSSKAHLTPEEYLAFERQAENKNEYFDGEVLSLHGFNRRHCLIASGVAAELSRQLRDGTCEVYISRMRVKVPAAPAYTYPDVVAVCGEPKCEDELEDTLLNPNLMIEVLRKPPATYDSVVRFGYYRTLESLTEYLLIAQDEYRVEQYTKQPDGRWLLTDIRGLESRVELASVGCTLALSEVYDRVSFD